MNEYQVSNRRACSVVALRRSTWFYKACGRDDSVLRARINEIAKVRIRYGYERIYVLLRREGWRDNIKRVYRVYCEEQLHLRNKRPKRNRAAAHRLQRLEHSSLHQVWSMATMEWTSSPISSSMGAKSGP